MIHIGNDFPDSKEQKLKDWNASLTIRKSADRPSTRGLLEYKDPTFACKIHFPDNADGLTSSRRLLILPPAKTFRSTTTLLSINENSLENTPLLASKSYHYLAAPADLEPRFSALLSLRKDAGILERPLLVWEPAPLSSTPENLAPCLEAAHCVDLFSPNHLELASLFSVPPERVAEKSTIEELALKVLSSGVGPEGKGAVVVRAGAHGSLVTAHDLPLTWVLPFYGSEKRTGKEKKIVDPTGAGNAFLGAYAVGYLKTGDVVQAACYGSVGASFALEQAGVPEKSGEGEEELWNGVSVFARLQEYLARGPVQSKVGGNSKS